MKIFNTMTRRKEEFVPLDKNEVKIYACGPTVYNFIHIGNARPLCLFDVLRRYLEYRGYNVRFVQNFTDVDDKIIKRANEEGLSFDEVSKKYIKEFWTDAHGLNFKDATVHPKATENIDEIINIIKTLEEKGYAYAVDGRQLRIFMEMTAKRNEKALLGFDCFLYIHYDQLLVGKY